MAKKREKELEAPKWLYWELERYGIAVADAMSRDAVHAVLADLKRGKSPATVAELHRLKGWTPVPPSKGQIDFLKSLGLPWRRPRNKRQAGLILDARLAPLKLYKRLYAEVCRALTEEQLDAIGRDIAIVLDVLPSKESGPLVEAGRVRRREIAKPFGEPF